MVAICYQAGRPSEEPTSGLRRTCARQAGPGCIPSPCLDADLASTLHRQRVASTGAVPKEGTVSMGRRLLIVMGFVLILAGHDARGQDQKAAGTTAQDSAAAPLPQSAPGEGVENGSDTTLRPVADAASTGSLSPGSEPATVESLPSAGTDPEPKQTPASPAGKQTKRLVPRSLDTEVMQAQGVPPAPTPVTASPAQGSPTPAEGSSEGPSFVLPSDRLPLGKQEVVLSVDVQAPANLNFNREATVKIIVKNSGST